MSEFNTFVTPATTVDVVIGFDNEGSEIFSTFAKGDLVVAGSLAYRITGFNSDNQALAYPHGLGHLSGPLAPVPVWLDLAMVHRLVDAIFPMRHGDGLVAFP